MKSLNDMKCVARTMPYDTRSKYKADCESVRTTPLAHWEEHAREFDRGVRDAAEAILGSVFDDRSYAQASLTPSLGGLGLRRVVDHADGAFAASWRESQSTAAESWSQPPQAEVHLGSQTKASLVVDTAIHPSGERVPKPTGAAAAHAVTGRARGGVGHSGPF